MEAKDEEEAGPEAREKWVNIYQKRLRTAVVHIRDAGRAAVVVVCRPPPSFLPLHPPLPRGSRRVCKNKCFTLVKCSCKS